MIVLITGASHTGKTALAQKLLEKYKYPYLSIDHLNMGLIRSGNTELTPMDDTELVELFRRNDTERVRAVTKTIAPCTHCQRPLAAKIQFIQCCVVTIPKKSSQ